MAIAKSKNPDVIVDKLPKSLFEYYANGYKENDIILIINNFKMDFDDWDKTYNFFRTSKNIVELSSDPVSIIYEEPNSANLFIYSFKTNLIYYYNSVLPPHIHLNQGMTIRQFMDVCYRDFQALLRTPYGKKYVTENAIITEGIREVFGFGKAIAIYLDDRRKSSLKTYACSEFTWACIDALDRYSPDKLVSLSDFQKICGRKSSSYEEYTNRKLKSPTAKNIHNRFFEIDEECKESEHHGVSFGYIMKKYNQEPERIYARYLKLFNAKQFYKNTYQTIKAFCKKNPALASAFSCGKSIDYQYQLNEADINSNMAISFESSYSDKFTFLDIDASLYSYEVSRQYKTKFDEFKKNTISEKFLGDLTKLLKAINSYRDSGDWCVYASIKENHDDFITTCDSKGYLVMKYPASLVSEMILFSDPNTRIANSKKITHSLLAESIFTYFRGTDTETYNQDSIKLALGSQSMTIPTFVSTESLAKILSDKDFSEKALIEAFEIIHENETVRKVANTMRAGIDKVDKTVHGVKHNAKELVAPIAERIKKSVDDIQKEYEDDSREIIITNSDFSRLKRLFTTAMALPVAATLIAGPVAGIITFLATAALKCDDQKMREKIIRELESELKITKEKINDASSDGNRNDKYALMRIESKIEDEIARIKYGRK